MTTARWLRIVLFPLFVLIVGTLRADARESDSLLLEASLNGDVAEVERLLDEGTDPNVFREGDNWTPLMLAAMNGNTAIVQILLDHDADPDRGNDEDGTALCVAAASFVLPEGDPDEIVAVLLDAGADLYGSNGSGMIALMYAAREGKTSVVERLLEAGTDVNYEDARQWSALVLAVTNDQTETAQVLLQAGADPNVRGEMSSWTPLSIAAQNDNTVLAGLLLEGGAEPNGLPSGGDYFASPIGYAAQHDNLELVGILLEKGALPNFSDGGYASEDGNPRTPLDWAKEHGNSAMEELLREAGAVDDLDGTYNAMLKAVRDDDAEEFRRLMEYRIDPRRYIYGDEEEVTLINETALRGNLEIMQTILSFPLAPNSYELWSAYETAIDNGFGELAETITQFSPGDIAMQAVNNGQHELLAHVLELAPEAANFTNSEEQTPLHMSAEVGDIQMVSMLLEAGALVDYPDRWGETPLFASARLGSTEIGEVLMEWEADIDSRSKNGMTPLHAAILASQDEMIEWLLEHGADLEAVDERGWNALHHAAWGGSGSTVRLLLNLGMDPDARSDQDETPLEIAQRIQNYEAEVILEEVMSSR